MLLTPAWKECWWVCCCLAVSSNYTRLLLLETVCKTHRHSFSFSEDAEPYVWLTSSPESPSLLRLAWPTPCYTSTTRRSTMKGQFMATTSYPFKMPSWTSGSLWLLFLPVWHPLSSWLFLSLLPHALWLSGFSFPHCPRILLICPEYSESDCFRFSYAPTTRLPAETEFHQVDINANWWPPLEHC